MSSNINKTLSSIPIKVVGSAGGRGVANYRWKRRIVQMTILLLLVLIPVSGLFRIDPENGAFVVLGWQIWFADFFLVTGLWIMLASALVDSAIASSLACSIVNLCPNDSNRTFKGGCESSGCGNCSSNNCVQKLSSFDSFSFTNKAHGLSNKFWPGFFNESLKPRLNASMTI